MALVAAWGECGEDAVERAALQWLEELAPPSFRVSMHGSHRTVCTSYVPVNDNASPISKKGKTETPLGSLAFGRARNGRSFPAVVPDDPTFHLVWPDVEVADQHRAAIVALCDKVTYLGHSATPIRMWVESAEIEPNLFPVELEVSIPIPDMGSGADRFI